METLEDDVQCLQPEMVIGWGEERQRRRGEVEIKEDPVLGGLSGVTYSCGQAV